MIGRRNLDGELRCLKAVEKTFDLRPIYRKTAAYGHFGRNDPDFTWEKTNKIEEFKSNL